MAERLMALVLKVQRKPKKLDKSKGSQMLDIGVLLFWGRLMSEKFAIRFINNRMANVIIKVKSDGKL